MKVLDRIIKGMKLAKDGFVSIYDTGNHILIYPVLSVLVGIPIFIYLLSLVMANGATLYLSASHLTSMKNLAAAVIWQDKLVAILVMGLLLTPFIGFLYTGVIKAVTSKKKIGLYDLFTVGFDNCKSLSFWALTFVASSMTIYLLSLVDLHVPQTLEYLKGFCCTCTVEFGIVALLSVLVSFMLVTFLMKKISIVDAARLGAMRFVKGLLEIIPGFIVWLLFSVLGYIGILFLFNLMHDMLSAAGSGIIYNNIYRMMTPFHGLWLIISITAWILFVYGVCKASKEK